MTDPVTVPGPPRRGAARRAPRAATAGGRGIVGGADVGIGGAPVVRLGRPAGGGTSRAGGRRRAGAAGRGRERCEAILEDG